MVKNSQDFGDDNIKVFVRLRPPNEESCDTALAVEGEHIVRTSSRQTQPVQEFTFDQVFDVNASQETVFEICGDPLAQEVIKGFNCTVFAYGQTGSGKSHTIFGPENGQGEDKDLQGLLPRTLRRIFTLFRTQHPTSEFFCKGSMVELYNEKIYDLLDPVRGSEQNLQLRESMSRGVYVENQTEVVFESAEDALETIRNGAEGRRIGATAMNRESSRSHTVFTLVLESKSTNDNDVHVSRSARLNIVDLAGSERQSLTQATGDRQKEANFINKSLLCLGTVISALASMSDIHKSSGFHRPHIKYRDSKLTFLLRDSLGGNSKTHMIANINPSLRYFAESLSTIKFAQRTKLIRNKAKINEDLSFANISAMQLQIKTLREQLESAKSACGDTSANSSAMVETARVEQLLTHALAATEAARQRSDCLKSIVDTKTEACSKLSKGLGNSKALLKMKAGQVSHLMKGFPGEKVILDWQAREDILWRDLNKQTIDAVEWRSKYDELNKTLQLEMARLGKMRELEEMNRKLCEETRVLLESKRELQDRLFSSTIAEDLAKANDSDSVKMATKGSRSSFSPSQSRRLSSASISSRTGLSSEEDFTRLEEKIVRKNLETRVKELEEQLIKNDVDTISAELAATKEELSFARQECEGCKSKLELMTVEISTLRKSEEGAKAAAAWLDAKVTSLQSQLLDIDSLREQLENVSAQNDLTESRLEELNKSSRLEKEVLENQLFEAKQEIEFLQASQQEHAEADVAQEQQQLQLQSEVESLTKLREAQQKTDALRIANLRNTISELQARDLVQTKQLEDLQRIVVEYGTSLNQERAKREGTENEVDQVRMELRDLEKVLEEERSDNETLRCTLSQAKSEIAQLHETQNIRERQLLAQLEDLVSERENTAAFSPETPKLETETCSTIDFERVSNLQEQLETERALRAEAESKVEELQIKAEELAAANSKLAGNSNLREKIKYVQKLKDHIHDLEENDAALRKKINRLEQTRSYPSGCSSAQKKSALALQQSDLDKENRNANESDPVTPCK